MITRNIKTIINRNVIRHFSVAAQSAETKTITTDPPLPPTAPRHVPVMLTETLKYLNPNDNEVFIDMTFGAGGHSRKILESGKNIKVYALDRDPTAHRYAQEMSEEFPGRLIPLLGRFSELPKLLQQRKVKQNSIDGILFDFGCSTMQLNIRKRGFSYKKNAYLDMRMDQDRDPNQPTAADILALANEDELYRIIKYYGEEKNARKIARTIVETRHGMKKIETTRELADVVNMACDGEVRLDKLDRPANIATKTFMALRIFVNNELNEINYGMIVAEKLLKIGGRLVTLCFHSLEDTIVKRHITGNIADDAANEVPLKYVSHLISHDQSQVEILSKTNWQQLHKHVIIPRFEEIEENPRARSAKMRAAIKVSNDVVNKV